MGFWDEVNDAKADFERPFLKGDEKKQLAVSNESFRVVGVRANASGNFGPEWRVDADLADGRKVTISFQDLGGSFRDNVLAMMAEHFGNNGAEPIVAKIEARTTKSGNTTYALVQP